MFHKRRWGIVAGVKHANWTVLRSNQFNYDDQVEYTRESTRYKVAVQANSLIVVILGHPKMTRFQKFSSECGANN